MGNYSIKFMKNFDFLLNIFNIEAQTKKESTMVLKNYFKIFKNRQVSLKLFFSLIFSLILATSAFSQTTNASTQNCEICPNTSWIIKEDTVAMAKYTPYNSDCEAYVTWKYRVCDGDTAFQIQNITASEGCPCYSRWDQFKGKLRRIVLRKKLGISIGQTVFSISKGTCSMPIEVFYPKELLDCMYGANSPENPLNGPEDNFGDEDTSAQDGVWLTSSIVCNPDACCKKETTLAYDQSTGRYLLIDQVINKYGNACPDGDTVTVPTQKEFRTPDCGSWELETYVDPDDKTCWLTCKDKEYKRSIVSSSSNTSKYFSEVKVYPNPLNGEVLNLEIPKIKSKILKVSITNLKGEIILEKRYDQLKNKESIQEKIEIPVEKFGKTMLLSISNGKDERKIFVIQK